MNFRKSAWLFSIILLASGAFLPEPTRAASASPMPPAVSVRGIDLPSAAGSAAERLKTHGVDFVARYYRRADSRWPSLSADEAREISSRGLSVVAIWEAQSRTPSYFSFLTGYEDALDAYRQAIEIGQPPGSAIYFAVDYDARPADIDGRVEEYFRGVNTGFVVAAGGIPVYRVGVYGSGAVCDSLKKSGLADYAWLSVSRNWLGSRRYDDWDIKQGKPLSGLRLNHDSDEAKEDYGGFRIGDT